MSGQLQLSGVGLLVTIGIVSAVLCAAILALLLRTGWAWDIAVDIPNHRSLHERPVPRVGGWGVLTTSVLAIVLFAPSLRWIAASALMLGVVSQIDDRRGLPARVRFAAHMLAVAVAVVVGANGISWWFAIIVGIALVWLVNLYNFMDGSNGLAGGMTLFGFSTYALAASSAHGELASVCAAVAGAAVGFLLFNLHPARVFLGDMGSIPLGFLAGTLGYWGWQHGAWPIWMPPLVFAPFIADATVTLLRRIARGERFWEAHREHYYQRLVQMTGSHVRVALTYGALMLCGSLLAITATRTPPAVQWAMCLAWYGALAIAGLFVDAKWRRWTRAAG
jgi:UDP-N-acetylmuramyl pentapeptide phosphotransferase/UDP-N-acetylglucosamine-1-phosphate transferase